MQAERLPVLIIGGGVAGPALALFLKKAGIPCVIFEARQRLESIGGGLQVAPNGMNVLKELGLSEPLIAAGQICTHFEFRNHRGDVLSTVANGSAEQFGSPAVMCKRAALHTVLVEELERQKIPVHYGKRLQAYRRTSDRSVTVTFEDGTEYVGEFVVGADGVHSRARRLAVPGAAASYTGVWGLGGFVQKQDMPVPPTTTVMTFGPAGFFGYSPLDARPDGMCQWWSNVPEEKELSQQELAALDSETVRAKLLQIHSGWHFPVERTIAECKDVLFYPIYDLPTLSSWHNADIVLIGDAAHAMSPHAGQGASCALEDSIVLAKMLRDLELPRVEVFELFEKARRARTEAIVREARRRGDQKKTMSPLSLAVREFVVRHLLPTLFRWEQNALCGYRVCWTEKFDVEALL